MQTKEIIETITECDFDHDRSEFEGYVIKTNLQTIKVGISSDQSCCEQYGYVSSLDNPEEFIGASLSKINIVDKLLTSIDVDTRTKSNILNGNAMFVNFYTSVGKFQVVAYNMHNGYYGHDAVLVSTQQEVTECL